jgi:hypothetical protein
VAALALAISLTACGSLAGCATQAAAESSAGQRLTDREAIEEVLARANLGFELSDPDKLRPGYASALQPQQ